MCQAAVSERFAGIVRLEPTAHGIRRPDEQPTGRLGDFLVMRLYAAMQARNGAVTCLANRLASGLRGRMTGQRPATNWQPAFHGAQRSKSGAGKLRTMTEIMLQISSFVCVCESSGRGSRTQHGDTPPSEFHSGPSAAAPPALRAVVHQCALCTCLQPW